MRKTALLSIVVLLAGSIGMAQNFRTLDQIQGNGTIVIGTEGAFPPFNYFDAKGKLTGFDIAVGNALAKQMDLKPNWKAQSFDTLLISLNQGRFDFVIASHTITPERSRAVDFTHPYYCTGNVIVAKPGGPDTKAALPGKKIGVQVGTTYMQSAEKIPGVKSSDIKSYATNPEVLQGLLSGRLDAWITDQFTALNAEKKRDVKLQISNLLDVEQIGIAVAKGNTTLLNALNKALAKIQSNGTYLKISDSYFGKDIRCK